MSERAEFHVMGQPLDGTPLHYTASGLDYVYLLNGFAIEKDPDYGRIVSIQNEGDLHRAIGLYVITRQRGLSGAEFRFLRKQMKYTQKELAKDLGVNEQTVANYEKERKIPPPSDRLIRMSFMVWLTPEDARADLIKRIAEVIRGEGKPKPMAVAMPPTDIQTSIARQWQGNTAPRRKAPSPVLQEL
jgi:DNA-binding transcriptional regulator YiaG